MIAAPPAAATVPTRHQHVARLLRGCAAVGVLAASVLVGVPATVDAVGNTYNVPCGDIAALRSGFDSANRQVGGTATVVLAAGCTYQLTDLAPSESMSALPTLTNALGATLIVEGNGATLLRPSNAPRFRFFTIEITGTATIRNLTFTGGHTPNNSASGGTGFDGGAIHNSGTLQLESVTISGNATGAGGNASNTSSTDGNPGGDGGKGGGILNDGNLTVVNSTITGNTTGPGATGGNAFVNGGTGGVGGYGGGIAGSGYLAMHGSVVSNNTTGGGGAPGGGILGGPAGGPGEGGGIATTGDVDIETSLFLGNTVGSWGGAIAAVPTNPGHTLNITNSTFVDNVGSRAGAIYATNATVELAQVTLTGNNATDADPGRGAGGDVAALEGGAVMRFSNTLMFDNGGAGDDCDAAEFGGNSTYQSRGGTLTDQGNTSCPRDLSGDPLLGALASNGGPTQTRLPAASSIALNNGDNARCAATDQRGVVRPQGTQCDIGAVERATVPNAGTINGAAITLAGIARSYSSTATNADEHSQSLEYTWSVTGVPATISNGTTSAASIVFTGTGQAVVRVRVRAAYASDDESVGAQTSVRVGPADDAGPSLTLVDPPSTVDEGGTLSFLFTASDPEGDSIAFASGFPDCGSGASLVSSSVGASGGTFTCRYPNGPTAATARVQLVDDFGVASPLRTQQVSVADVVPQILLFGETSPDEGPDPLTYSYTFSDPGTDTYGTPEVSCGDRGQLVPGSASFSSSGHDFSGSFQCVLWAGPLTFEPTVTIRSAENPNQPITATMTVDVLNVAPTATLSEPYVVDEDLDTAHAHVFTYVLSDVGGFFEQPTIVTGSVSCGTGGTLRNYSVSGFTGGTITCLFPDGPATPNVSFQVRDIDGAVTNFSQAIDVLNVPPTVTFVGPVPEPVYEGTPMNTQFSARDQGRDTPSATPPSFCSLTGQNTVTPNSRIGNVVCSFPDGPADTVATLSVSDVDGGTASASFTQHVLNVAPTITGSIDDFEITAGDTVRLTLGQIVDPGDDHVSAITIHWGDGTTQVLGPEAAGTEIPHVYRSYAFARIVVDLADEDGTYLDLVPALGPLVVRNPAPFLEWTELPTSPKEAGRSTFEFSILDDAFDTHTITSVSCGTPRPGGTAVASNASITGTTGTFDCTWADSGFANDIIVRVVDSSGNPAEIRTSVTVANSPPVVTPSPTNVGTVEASPTTARRFTFTATDPGNDEMIALNFINGIQPANSCGAGSIVDGFGSEMNGHVLTAWIDCIFPDGAPTRTVVMHITDFFVEDTVRAELTVNVLPQPLTATFAFVDTIREGDTTTFSYSVHDPGNDGYAVVGPPSCGAAGSLVESGTGFFTCRFPDGPATSTVSISLVDTGTATTTTSASVTVSVVNVKPTLFMTGETYYQPGVPYEVTVHPFTEPGDDMITSWTIHWDTLNDPTSSTTYTSLSPTPSHVYTVGGRAVSLVLTVTDEDGTHDFVAMPLIAYDQDTEPPLVEPPADMTVEATGPSGAVVSFSATATDDVDGPIPAACATSGQTFSIGEHTVTCTASDAAGNPAQATFTIIVEDTTGPTITVPSDITAEATSADGALVSYEVTADDLVDGSRPATCAPLPATVFAIGDTTVTCTSVDSHGNDSSETFSVTVADTTAPTLTAPTTTTFEAFGPAGAAATFTVAVDDLVDGSPSAVSCAPASGTTFVLGTTSVTCTTTDDADNEGTITFDITVVDTTGPTITAPSTTTFEATGPDGAIVALGDVTADDLVDGTVAVTCTPAAGSLFALGTTHVTCSATDTRDNPASIEFDIVVEDTTDPTVTIDQAAGQPDPTDVSSIEFAVTFSETVTGFDADDIELSGTSSVATAMVVVSGSGSSYTVTVSGLTDGGSVVAAVEADAATDPSGNGNTASTSTDNTVTYSPIVIHVPTDIATNNDPGQNGAIVSWPSITTSGGVAPVTLVCDHTSGSRFAIGTTTVTCTASYTDPSTEDREPTSAAGRPEGAPQSSVVATFSIQVADAEAPVVSGAPPAVQATSPGKGPIVVTFALPTAIDNNGTTTVVCSPASGSPFPVGVTTVTCTATDGAGNDTVVTFPVTVAAAPSAPGRGIPATGGDPLTILVWAVGLLAFGAMALRARRVP